MKKYAITLLFLLFDLGLINGHSLAKIELNNITDVYEVNEDKSTISITHPKDSRPTLREIIYYHIIEKPYDQDEDQDDQVDIKTPDLDKIRSFTNGHGYQYLNEEDSGDDSNLDDSDISKRIDEDNGGNDTADEEYEEDEETITEAGLTSTAHSDIDSKSYDEIVNLDEDKTKDDENKKPDNLNNKPITDDLDVRFGDEDTGNIEIKDTQEEEKSRRKRGIDYTNIPDAPSLPDFDLDILPDYIKAILLEEPDTYQKSKQKENFEEEIEKEIKKLKELANHPPQKKGNNGQKRKARTYGMSLTGDRGVVWNDVSATHVAYHVGEPESVKSTTSKPTDIPDTTIKTTTIEVPDEPTSEPVENVEDSDELKDIEASFDEINKMLEELIKESTSKPDVTTNNDDDSKITDNKTDSTTEMTSTESITEKTTKNPDSEIESSTQKPDNENPSSDCLENKEGKTDDKKKLNDRKDVNKGANKQKDEDSKQKQFVMELMKNKYFWQWLQDSSAAYLEIMMKKVDLLIKAEVEKQIKEHKNDINSCKINDNSTSQNVTEKPIKTSNDTDLGDISTTQTPLMNNTIEKPVETTNVTDEVTVNTTQRPNVNNTETNEITKLEKNKNNGNETGEARKNNKNDKNTDTPVKIEAQNVYGNSVGNGKVTNIFIFNISKESDLQNIKPLNNGTNGVFVFGLDDKNPTQEKIDKDENKTEKDKEITAKPEVTDDQSKINNKESHENKSADNQASTAMPETAVNEKNETYYEQTTPKPTSTGDYQVDTTLKPVNDIVVTSTTEAVEVTTKEPAKDLSEESKTDIVKEKPIDKSNSTDIDREPTDNINKTKPETNKNNDNNGDKIEETTDNDTTDNTRDTNTTESSDHESEKSDTENKTEKEKNNDENEINHSE